MSSDKKISSIGSTVIEEIFSYLSIPGGASASYALNKVFEKKAEEAREILLEEISRGGTPIMAEDDAVYIIYRYLRAAQEGAARANLQLLAKVISGHTQIGDLKANQFLYYADILSSLRTEEIKLLGVMVRQRTTSSYAVEEELKGQYPDMAHDEIFQSLVRTGLVAFYHETTVEDNDDWKQHNKYNSEIHTSYHLTPLMDEICNFIDWDEFLDKQS